MKTLDRRLLLQIVLLVALSVLVYSRNLDDYFRGDDFDLIHSFYGKGPGYMVALLYNDEAGDVWDVLCLAPDSTCPDPENHGFIRPFKMWLLGADFLLWGTNPIGYHVTCTILFAANVVLSLLVLRALLPAQGRAFAFLGAWVVAIHPVFAAVVTSITFREEAIASACTLAALYGFLCHRRYGRSPAPFYVFYALALLTKESAITTVGLPLAYDAAYWIVSDRTRDDLWRRARTYLPVLPMLAVYFGLRYAAFGNLVGGHGETDYLSWELFRSFHTMSFNYLFVEPMFSLHAFAWIKPLVVVTSIAAVAWLLVRRARLDRDDLAALLFLGPGWYAATTAIAYGVYFSPRHIAAPVIGLILFVAYLLYCLTRVAGWRSTAPLAAAIAMLATLAFLPPTLTASLTADRLSDWVRDVRAGIDAGTAGVADGDRILLIGVPPRNTQNPYFGQGLDAALQRPFTESDLTNRPLTIDVATPGRSVVAKDYDVVLRFDPPPPPLR